MLFLKFSLVFFISFHAWSSGFTSRDCIQGDFSTSINHEGKFFGLIKNDLKIEKAQCNITITYKKILETSWEIDICREPIHMKVQSKGSQSVYKRDGSCEGESSDYCEYLKDLISIIQDHGLIFAQGDREDFTSSHGQTYCTYRLLDLYLSDGKLFSKYSENVNIFKNYAKPVKPVSKIEIESRKESVKKEASYDEKASGLLESKTDKNFKPMVEEEGSSISPSNESEEDSDDPDLKF